MGRATDAAERDVRRANDRRAGDSGRRLHVARRIERHSVDRHRAGSIKADMARAIFDVD